MENTTRKNAIDTFASREYLRDETMTTYKRALGLQYIDMDEPSYKKVDLEVGLPGVDSSSFIKVDCFMAKYHILIEERLKLVWQI